MKFTSLAICFTAASAAVHHQHNDNYYHNTDSDEIYARAAAGAAPPIGAAKGAVAGGGKGGGGGGGQQAAKLAGELHKVQDSLNGYMTTYKKTIDGKTATADNTNKLILDVQNQVASGMQFIDTSLQHVGPIPAEAKKLLVSPFFDTVIKSSELITATWAGRAIDSSMEKPLVTFRTALTKVGAFATKLDQPEYASTLQSMSGKINTLIKTVQHGKVQRRDPDQAGAGVAASLKKISANLNSYVSREYKLEDSVGFLHDVQAVEAQLEDMLSLTGNADPILAKQGGLFDQAVSKAVTVLGRITTEIDSQKRTGELVPQVHMLASSVGNLAGACKKLKLDQSVSKLKEQANFLAHWANPNTQSVVSPPGADDRHRRRAWGPQQLRQARVSFDKINAKFEEYSQKLSGAGVGGGELGEVCDVMDADLHQFLDQIHPIARSNDAVSEKQANSVIEPVLVTVVGAFNSLSQKFVETMTGDKSLVGKSAKLASDMHIIIKLARSVQNNQLAQQTSQHLSALLSWSQDSRSLVSGLGAISTQLGRKLDPPAMLKVATDLTTELEKLNQKGGAQFDSMQSASQCVNGFVNVLMHLPHDASLAAPVNNLAAQTKQLAQQADSLHFTSNLSQQAHNMMEWTQQQPTLNILHGGSHWKRQGANIEDVTRGLEVDKDRIAKAVSIPDKQRMLKAVEAQLDALVGFLTTAIIPLANSSSEFDPKKLVIPIFDTVDSAIQTVLGKACPASAQTASTVVMIAATLRSLAMLASKLKLSTKFQSLADQLTKCAQTTQ